jgi:hypothetical protein
MPVFDPEIVHECSMKCLGLPKPQMFDVFARPGQAAPRYWT